MSDAHYLTSRNIQDQRAVNHAVREHLHLNDAGRAQTKLTRPIRVCIASAAINNGAVGSAAIAKGATSSLTASSTILQVLNLTGSTIASGSKFVAAHVSIPESNGGAWVAMLGASATTIEQVYYGTAAANIPANGSGNVTSAAAPNGEGATVTCFLSAAHGGQQISSGKSVIYVKRVTGSRLIIAAECETVSPPPPPDNPTLSGFSPSDRATGVSGTASLSWTSDGDSWDVWFGVPGNLSRYPVTSATLNPPGTLPSGQYVWQVIAYNVEGGQTFGPYNTFTV